MSIITIDLDTFAYGGETIGRLKDGRAVFVPYSLPGERVRVSLIEEKKGFARAKLIDVIEPSPQRTNARCPHFMDCGGCHYQHIPYDVQLQSKSEILSDVLTRCGNLCSK